MLLRENKYYCGKFGESRSANIIKEIDQKRIKSFDGIWHNNGGIWHNENRITR